MNADVAFFMLFVVNLQIRSLLWVVSVEPATCATFAHVRAPVGVSLNINMLFRIQYKPLISLAMLMNMNREALATLQRVARVHGSQ